MLASESLLKALGETEMETNNYIDNNDDYDLGEVLKFCCENKTSGHKIRCSDGQMRVFSFDN